MPARKHITTSVPIAGKVLFNLGTWSAYEAAKRGQAYQPAAQLNLAILRSNEGDPLSAEGHYLRALEIDDHFLPARFNLAMLYNALGRNREAEKLLREVVRLQPDWGQGHYSLGLLLAEDRSRLRQAADHLARAARNIPDNPRVHYNLGIALWQLEERDKAAAAILTAAKLEPINPEFPQSLAQLYAQSDRWKEALPHAERAAELMPENSQVQSFLVQVRARAGK